MNKLHFEDLWIKCESFHKENDPSSKIESLNEELLMTTNLLSALSTKKEIPEDEQKKIKSRLIGEILLILTNISLKEDIDVYSALQSALMTRSIDFFDKKY